jgi:uncharacterized membrane protein
MNESAVTQVAQPSDNERNLLLVAYVLYGVTPFTGGIAAVAAVIINHLKVNETAGSYLGSHHRWLLRTFWFSLLWTALCTVLMFTIVLIPVAWIGYVVVGIWYIYRVVRGAMRFADKQAMPL